MARVTVEDCLGKVGNRFELVLLASKRARQLSSSAIEPKVPWEGDKPQVVALREIAEGYIDMSLMDQVESPEAKKAEQAIPQFDPAAEQQMPEHLDPMAELQTPEIAPVVSSATPPTTPPMAPVTTATPSAPIAPPVSPIAAPIMPGVSAVPLSPQPTKPVSAPATGRDTKKELEPLTPLTPTHPDDDEDSTTEE